MKNFLLFLLITLSSSFLLSQTVPNGTYYGSTLMCNSGYKNVGGKCLKLPAVSNGTYYGSTLMCNSGYKNVGGKCLKLPAVSNGTYYGSTLMCNSGYKNVGGKCNKMTPQEAEQQRIEMAIIAAQAANREFYIDDEKFTLRDISKKCEVYRYSDNYGDVECRGYEFRVIERKCEAYFSDKNDKSGELECRGSDFRPIERYCSSTMYSDNYGDIDC